MWSLTVDGDDASPGARWHHGPCLLWLSHSARLGHHIQRRLHALPNASQPLHSPANPPSHYHLGCCPPPPPLLPCGGCCLGGCCHRRCLLLCFNLFLEGTLEPLLVKVDFVLHSKLALEMIPDAFASDALQLARREELRDAEAHLVLV